MTFVKRRRISLHRGSLALGLMIMVLLTSGCKDKKEVDEEPDSHRDTITQIKVAESLGVDVLTNDSGTISFDASDLAHGHIIVKYTGTADKVQVQVEDSKGNRTPYPLKIGSNEAIPFTEGNGDYKVTLLEHVENNLYSIGLSQDYKVEMRDENDAFCYPNQYSDYNPDSACVKKGREISDFSSSDLDYIKRVYNFIIKEIKYDEEFAKNIPVNYIPNPDETLSTKKGICLDYASLTTAMLRSQGLPTKLEVGYSGDAYHAWISVWTKETGWIDNVIRFDGKKWTLIDPTLAANNSKQSVRKYIGDGSNYTLKFVY